MRSEEVSQVPEVALALKPLSLRIIVRERLMRRGCMRKVRHEFRKGDWIRIVKSPSGLTDAAKIGTAQVFEQAVGKTFRIEGFDRYGHIELVVTKLDTIWIEPELVVHAKKPRTRKGSI